MEELELKKYITPEIEIENFSSFEDIMSASMEVTEEENTLKGIIDIESLMARIKELGK